jgi:hypothetical protein
MSSSSSSVSSNVVQDGPNSVVHPGGCYLQNELIRCALDEFHCEGLDFVSSRQMRESEDPAAKRCKHAHPDFVGMCTSETGTCVWYQSQQSKRTMYFESNRIENRGLHSHKNLFPAVVPLTRKLQTASTAPDIRRDAWCRPSLYRISPTARYGTTTSPDETHTWRCMGPARRVLPAPASGRWTTAPVPETARPHSPTVP